MLLALTIGRQQPWKCRGTQYSAKGTGLDEETVKQLVLTWAVTWEVHAKDDAGEMYLGYEKRGVEVYQKKDIGAFNARGVPRMRKFEEIILHEGPLLKCGKQETCSGFLRSG